MTITHTFYQERETKGTVVYSRQTESGRKETQYVSKAALSGARPETITVTIDWEA